MSSHDAAEEDTIKLITKLPRADFIELGNRLLLLCFEVAHDAAGHFTIWCPVLRVLGGLVHEFWLAMKCVAKDPPLSAS